MKLQAYINRELEKERDCDKIQEMFRALMKKHFEEIGINTGFSDKPLVTVIYIKI